MPTAQELIAQYQSGGNKPLTTEQILGTSKTSRGITTYNSNKLDAMSAPLDQASQAQRERSIALSNGTITDQKSMDSFVANQKTNQEQKDQTLVSQSLESGNQWIYLKDGTRTQIPANEDPAKYGGSLTAPASTSPATTYGPDGKPTLTPEQQSLQNQSTQYQNDINTAKEQLMRNSAQYDATTQALLQSITATYDARLKKMEDMNARYLEGKRISGIATGRSRYTPMMEEGILSTEEMDGQARLAELEAEKLGLIVKAKQARDDLSIKQFNEYMGLLDKKNKDAVDTITKLHQMAVDRDNALIARERAEREAKQGELNYQQDLATSLARDAFKNLAGLSEEEQQAYISKLAMDKGIDPSLLDGAIQDYRDKEETQNSQIAQREASASAREQQIAISRERLGLEAERVAIAQEKASKTGSDKTYTDGKLTYSESDINTSESLLQNGGEFNGVMYNPAGSDDGYSDPYLYKALFDYWIYQGGTKAGFVKKFPPKDYINSSASNLPDFLMPQ